MQQELLSKKALLVTLFLYWTDRAHARVGKSRTLASNSCYPNARKIRLESTSGDVIAMFELQAMSSGVNVALGKTASQSSTYTTKSASFAIDGDTTTFAHTAADDVNAWWEVDLQNTYSTESILIKNRWCVDVSDPNECLCRMSGAKLSLLNEQDEVIHNESIGDTCGVYDLNFDLSSSCTDSCYPEADTVKIESTSGEVIAMFELQAISSGVNVALGKTASQSSTYTTKSASFAVDGDEASFSHTAADDVSAWWQVNLGGTFSTESIQIKNRWCVDASDPNECLCRLSGAKLSLLNAGQVVATKMIDDTCGVHNLSFDMSTCNTPISSVANPSIPFSEAVVTDDSFAITFTNPLSQMQTEIFAAVIGDSHCADVDTSFEVDSSTANFVKSAQGSSEVTVTKSIKELITTEDKNNGSVKLNFCLRADVWAAGFPSSLLASKVSVGITATFDNSGTIGLGGTAFNLEVETAHFTDTSAEYSTERGVEIAAILGECASPGSEGPYKIGSTLRFCLKSVASDVVISGLNDVSFTDINGNPILGIVNGDGEASIVTNIAGLDSKTVDVTTMMASTIFDQGFGGQVINVQGKVLVSYVDGTRRRQLKATEEAKPFAVRVLVADSTYQVDRSQSLSANGAFGGVLLGILLVGGIAKYSARA